MATTSSAPPFRFLQETEADKLVRALLSERPQTIARCFRTCRRPARARCWQGCRKVCKWKSSIASSIWKRPTRKSSTRSKQALRGRLAEHVQTQRRRVAGLQAVAGILQATDGRTGIRILDNLARGDRTLADQLMPRQMTFGDLADLDVDVLAEVLDEAGLELLLPALLGAEPGLTARVLSCLPATDARVRPEARQSRPDSAARRGRSSAASGEDRNPSELPAKKSEVRSQKLEATTVHKQIQP